MGNLSSLACHVVLGPPAPLLTHAAAAVPRMGRTESNALIVHPEWHHTLPLHPVCVSFWDECCDGVLTKIAAGTLVGNDHQSLASLMLVNQRCRRIAAADDLWRQLCLQRFNTPPDLSSPDMSWRKVYRFNHEAYRWLVQQAAVEALMKLGIRVSTNTYTLQHIPFNMA